MNTLSWLQDWYRSQCNGSWEHGQGIKIDTLDNPGWMLTVDLEETELRAKSFGKKVIERSETDWVHCWVEKEKFQARCGAENLEEVLTMFRAFATETY